ncbi:Uncharacterized protein TCM_016765 [Theobroma cacao]|uniref:Uncharacterized protein n=1 Tax=Theobroma cacao TaxID=3641 RepID=A0A061EBE9_THECC|nr:Uncharacterized protein TCM_016765 [Theobroma cacao]
MLFPLSQALTADEPPRRRNWSLASQNPMLNVPRKIQLLSVIDLQHKEGRAQSTLVRLQKKILLRLSSSPRVAVHPCSSCRGNVETRDIPPSMHMETKKLKEKATTWTILVREMSFP